jgi:serine/threonine protein phosphatase PrpC
LDHRCHFVDYHQSYHLYLWHMLDNHSLLGSAIQRLGDSVAASNAASGVPQVIDVDASSFSKSLLKGSPPGGGSAIKNLSQSIASLADAAKLDAQAKSIDRQHERQLQRERAEAERQLQRERAEAERQLADRSFHHQREERMRDSIDNLKIEKRKLAVTMVDYATKKNKTAVDMLQQQIDEINQEMEKKEKLLQELLEQ